MYKQYYIIEQTVSGLKHVQGPMWPFPKNQAIWALGQDPNGQPGQDEPMLCGFLGLKTTMELRQHIAPSNPLGAAIT